MEDGLGEVFRAKCRFNDHEPAEGPKNPKNPLTLAKRSPAARRQAPNKLRAENLPVQIFPRLLADFVTLTRNTIEVKVTNTPASFEKITTATPLQQLPLDFLRIKLVV